MTHLPCVKEHSMAQGVVTSVSVSTIRWWTVTTISLLSLPVWSPFFVPSHTVTPTPPPPRPLPDVTTTHKYIFLSMVGYRFRRYTECRNCRNERKCVERKIFFKKKFSTWGRYSYTTEFSLTTVPRLHRSLRWDETERVSVKIQAHSEEQSRKGNKLLSTVE